MAELPPPAETLVGSLAAALDVSGVGVRFLDRHENATTHSFDEIWSRARAAAGAIEEAGVVPGDRVVIVSPTEIGFYDAFFGVLMAGAIPTPVYPPVRLGRVEEWAERTGELVDSVGAAAIIGDRRSRRLLGQVVARVAVPLGVMKLEQLHTHEELIEIAHPRPDDIALIQFSSGTTRTPAPVTLTHRQILANIEVIVASLPLPAFDGGGCVSWLPLYHDMGLIGCLLTSLRCAQPMTLIPPEVFLMRPAIWLRAISTYGATVSPAPNFAYRRTVEKVGDDELAGVDLSSWYVAMNGAEPIAAEGMRLFTERFGRYGFRPEAMTPVYGLAEAALAVTFSSMERPYEVRSFDRESMAAGEARLQDDGILLPSLGTPLPGYELEIRDASGDAVDEARVGRLFVRGPSITSGYYRGDAPVSEGWLDTGDRGFLLDGELFVCGREKDVIVVRGRNHAPFEVERACDEVDGVRTGCVVAVSDLSSEGERLHVFIEVRTEREDLSEACVQAIRARTGIEPFAVHLVEPGTLPRTSSGKLRRRETLERFQRDELTAPSKVTTFHLASEVAKSAIGYLKR